MLLLTNQWEILPSITFRTWSKGAANSCLTAHHGEPHMPSLIRTDYEYDAAFRLTKESVFLPSDVTAQTSREYEHADGAGNRTGMVFRQDEGSCLAIVDDMDYTYNGLNQIVSNTSHHDDGTRQTGPVAYDFDANGSMTSRELAGASAPVRRRSEGRAGGRAFPGESLRSPRALGLRDAAPRVVGRRRIGGVGELVGEGRADGGAGPTAWDGEGDEPLGGGGDAELEFGAPRGAPASVAVRVGRWWLLVGGADRTRAGMPVPPSLGGRGLAASGVRWWALAGRVQSLALPGGGVHRADRDVGLAAAQGLRGTFSSSLSGLRHSP